MTFKRKDEVVTKAELVEEAQELTVSAPEGTSVEDAVSPEVKAIEEQYEKNWSVQKAKDDAEKLRALEDAAALRAYGEQANALADSVERAYLLNQVVLEDQKPREQQVLKAAGITDADGNTVADKEGK